MPAACYERSTMHLESKETCFAKQEPLYCDKTSSSEWHVMKLMNLKGFAFAVCHAVFFIRVVLVKFNYKKSVQKIWKMFALKVVCFQQLEPCIGCMQQPANIKLQKMCAPSGEGECVPCYCRPMWCIECMAKWFASRQDQHQPETWLASTSPCPTCRSKFCMLDVCLIATWTNPNPFTTTYCNHRWHKSLKYRH